MELREGRIIIGESIRVALKFCAITFERLTTFFVWSLPKSSEDKEENEDSGHEQLHWQYITEMLIFPDNLLALD